MSTTPKPPAPKPTHRQVWERLKAENPHRAAIYLNRFGDQVFAPDAAPSTEEEPPPEAA